MQKIKIFRVKQSFSVRKQAVKKANLQRESKLVVAGAEGRNGEYLQVGHKGSIKVMEMF